MKRALAVLALLVGAGCGPQPADDDRGAPIDPPVVTAAKSAGFVDCPTGAGHGPLAGLTLTCLTTGTEVRLTAGQRLPTVVNVWASWCQQCRDELPLLARAAKAYAGRVRFVGVVFADKAPLDAIALAKRLHVSYAMYADPGSRTRQPFGLRGLPQTEFLDPSGAIVATQYTPYATWQRVTADIDRYLGVAP